MHGPWGRTLNSLKNLLGIVRIGAVDHDCSEFCEARPDF